MLDKIATFLWLPLKFSFWREILSFCKSCFTLAWKCRDYQLSRWWWIQEGRLRSSGAETPIDLRRSLNGPQWLGCGTVEGNGDTPSIFIYVRASMTDDLLSNRVSPVTLPAQLSIWILRLMVCLFACVPPFVTHQAEILCNPSPEWLTSKRCSSWEPAPTPSPDICLYKETLITRPCFDYQRYINRMKTSHWHAAWKLNWNVTL